MAYTKLEPKYFHDSESTLNHLI